MFFYKNYKYSTLATLVSGISSLGAVVLFILGCFGGSLIDSKPIKIVVMVISIAAAFFIFVYCSRILPDKIAEKDFAKKIKTSAAVALLYCNDHPDEFDAIAAENPNFAAKYRKDENGKIVKNK